MRLVAILVLGFFLFAVPGNTWAASTNPQEEIKQRLKNTQSQEYALLQEIFHLDANLQALAAKKLALTTRYQTLTQELALAREKEKELTQKLAASRENFSRSLQFFQKHMVTPYLMAAILSQNWADFFIRWELLEQYMYFLLNRVYHHLSLYKEAQKIRETVERQEREVAKAALEVTQLEEKLEAMKIARQEALEKVKNQVAQYEQALFALERAWQETLPTLMALFQRFPQFPWEKLTPDKLRVNYARGTVVAEFSQQKINKVLLEGQHSLKHIKFVLSPGTLSIPGPGFLLQGTLAIAGTHNLTFTPQTLELSGVPLDKSVWDVLLPQTAFSIELPAPAFDLKFSHLEIQEGRIVLELSRI
ncbi:hypothetical protein SAMN00808754_0503 [Thermanaeromonas toyohensis ToBE]|uniref:N-terminal domain of peptidoglycan hydrolase CwlO-containing protein n=1 Tax=Thermanaeromonas toyohensis ToBE TaxID=698762 RepID=A0A1W1VEP5_9FIRM|nr:hypothetical protein [Thermanaeromonas toyohensis]SMB91693.1 hypothetical protein SAMN00808754_0503 [Thermanaeromonas toyohensis ToBE]